MTVGGPVAGTYAEQVAAEVRAMMGRRRMTQTEVAEALGVTQMYVSRRVKKTNPTPMDVSDLARFARVLDCSVLDLLPRLDPATGASDTRRYRQLAAA